MAPGQSFGPLIWVEVAGPGAVTQGSIVISTVGQTTADTDLWVYDSARVPIALYGNDDEPAPGTTLQSSLTQTYVPGNLKEMLLARGYDAFIVTSKSKTGQSLYRVNIGKFSERKRADSIAKKIRRETGMQTFVAVR